MMKEKPFDVYFNGKRVLTNESTLYECGQSHLESLYPDVDILVFSDAFYSSLTNELIDYLLCGDFIKND